MKNNKPAYRLVSRVFVDGRLVYEKYQSPMLPEICRDYGARFVNSKLLPCQAEYYLVTTPKL